MRRPTAAAAALALIALLFTVVQASPASAAPARQLSEKRATWTTSVLNPRSTVPGQQLKRVDLRVIYDWAKKDSTLLSSVQLNGVPVGAAESALVVGVGKLVGNDCRVSGYTNSRGLWSVDGVRTYTLSATLPADAGFNCGVAVVYDKSGPAPGSVEGPNAHDAMGGGLTDVYVSPKLAISSVALLGKKQSKLKLVRGVAQTYPVTVTNTGGLAATGVVITGSGKGMKVKKTKVGTIQPGKSVTVRVPITLKGTQKSTKVKLKVKGSGVTGTKSLKVSRTTAPAKAATGSWKGGRFKFKVKNGKITGFRGTNLRMECRAPLSYTTYRNVNLTFPTTKIPKHGYVEVTKSYRSGDVWYNVSLRGKFNGKKFTSGRFTYTTGGCTVVEKFSAKKA